MITEYYLSEDVPNNNILANHLGEVGESFLHFISPDRPYLRPVNFTSPSPDSNLSELTTNSTSQGLNASVEYNQSDEEKLTFDALLSRERWTNDVPEDLQLPRINNAKAGIQLIELTANGWSRGTKDDALGYFRQQVIPPYIMSIPPCPIEPHPQLQLRPILLEHPKPTPILPPIHTLGTISNPIIIDDTPHHHDEFVEVQGKYRVIEKIGEGTFSSVYKAVSLQDSDRKIVALKRIYSTCRPSRILNEIQHLKLLGGKAHVPPMYGGLRFRDQVTLVIPYFEHDKFKDYLPLLSLRQIKQYMRALFESLQHLHAHQVIHRDIKPGNFLYDVKNSKFMLVDFGLAQLQTELTPPSSPKSYDTSTPSPFTTRKRSNTTDDSSDLKRAKTSSSSSYTLSPTNAASILNSLSQLPPNPVAPSSLVSSAGKKVMQAPRAGTRGFRAPEVLLKYPYQTVAIDVWSAGIIFLCILSMRYPFFNSPDDLSALAEIGALCGTKEVREVGLLLGRKVQFPIEIARNDMKLVCQSLSSPRTYTIPDSAYDLLERCLDLNPFRRITADEALQHPFLSDP